MKTVKYYGPTAGVEFDAGTDSYAARRRGGRRLGPAWERDEVALDREDAIGHGWDSVDDMVVHAIEEAIS